MGKIHVLDDTLANKIAAGEVIERPANVVKELVENSIDAKAKSIQIEIKEGGLEMIRIIDDGIGMAKEDAKLCFMRHATSKIKDDFDLFRIQSLGFRGEAIPSIASIARFDLKTSQGQEGYHVTYEFGKVVEEGDADARKGCDMTITRLFQNVPARLKYMKSVHAEFAAIQGYVEKLALSYPHISFTLTHQDRLVFKTNGNGKLLEVIATIYGLQVAKNMIEVKFGDEEFEVSGYISKIDLSRSSKNYMMTLVNHRVVRNALTIDTINEVYRTYLAPDRYPLAFVNINVDPFLVDVIVHPAKLEVRFSKADQLRELMVKGIKEALVAQDLTYKATYNQPKERFSFKPNFTQEELVLEPTETLIPKVESFVKEQTATYELSSFDKEELIAIQEEPQKEIKEEIVVKPLKKKLMVKGQVRGTYIIAEDSEGMYLIDQHAAKERVNYEYYLDQFEKRDMRLQDMLIPIVLEYPQSEYMILNERKDALAEIGIELLPFGTSSFVVKQLPLWMKQIDEQMYIETMADQVLHTNKVDLLSLRKEAIATLSCKARVKGNTYLNTDNMQSIVDELMRCDNPYVCPHGRPTMIAYTDYELEKLFKRVV
jgi:DNA mismatch repair protein MutL